MDADEFKRQRERVEEAGRLHDAADELARRRNLLIQGGMPRLRVDRIDDCLKTIVDENDSAEVQEALVKAVLQVLKDELARLQAAFGAL